MIQRNYVRKALFFIMLFVSAIDFMKCGGKDYAKARTFRAVDFMKYGGKYHAKPRTVNKSYRL